jgi:mannosyltransferase OCH1-like enzyme
MKKSSKESFGKFIILHLKNLSKDLIRARSLKHLKAKALIPENLITHADIVKYIDQNISKDKINTSDSYYFDRFLDPSVDFEFIENDECFEASIIGRGIDQQDVGKSLTQFENFDFLALLKERLKSDYTSR